MKRLAVVFSLLSASIYALPLGNVADPELYKNSLCWNSPLSCQYGATFCNGLSLRIGFYGDYVYNRNLEVDQFDVPSSSIQNTTLNTNAGLLILNFWNWLDLFTTLGTTQLTITTSGSSFSNKAGTDSVDIAMSFPGHFSWSVGTRGTIWTYRCFSVGFEGQYFRVNSVLNDFSRVNTGRSDYLNQQAPYQEWQVGLGAVYRLTTRTSGVMFVPYLGTKWAGGNVNFGNYTFSFPEVATGNYTLYDLAPQKSWGLVVGMSALFCNTAGLTVEGRWADESAVSVNGQVRF